MEICDNNSMTSQENTSQANTPVPPVGNIGCHLSDCPPVHAKQGDANFYRVLKIGRLCKEAFIPRCNIPNGRFPDTCSENAVSLCTTEEAVRSYKAEFPAQSSKPVAEVKIRNIAPHGVWHQDSDHHANWWHQLNFDPTTIANIVEGL